MTKQQQTNLRALIDYVFEKERGDYVANYSHTHPYKQALNLLIVAYPNRQSFEAAFVRERHKAAPLERAAQASRLGLSGEERIALIERGEVWV